jgi:hypothetical protein
MFFNKLTFFLVILVCLVTVSLSTRTMHLNTTIESNKVSDVNTLLKKGIEYCNIKQVQEAITAGADVNFESILDETPLHKVVRKSSPTAKNPNSFNRWLNDSLIAIAQLLINAGADINRRELISGHSPLHLAIVLAKPALVQFLLNSPNIDLTTQDHWGTTLLEAAQRHVELRPDEQEHKTILNLLLMRLGLKATVINYICINRAAKNQVSLLYSDTQLEQLPEELREEILKP